ncbi:MAG: hypothetical protein KJ067_07150 [Vicinamibacteria bacterium]|nr:hypothetical protein [Vicinamibacteria bacterium]
MENLTVVAPAVEPNEPVIEVREQRITRTPAGFAINATLVMTFPPAPTAHREPAEESDLDVILPVTTAAFAF